MTNENNRKNWGEGVFAIHKKIFNYYNGFEGWLVAADSDFMARLYKNNISVELTQEILVLRRLHDKGLTSRPDTGLKSQLRSKYAHISKSKKYFGPLPILKIAEYKPIEIAEYTKKSVIAVEDTIINDGNDSKLINERKEMVNDVINSINNKKQKTKDVAPEKKPMIIDYEKVNKLLKNRVVPNPTPKVKKVDDTTKNTISNREMVKIIFPGKPNRRNDDQTMTFGKK
jgi:hypothetical protein